MPQELCMHKFLQGGGGGGGDREGGGGTQGLGNIETGEHV